MRRTDHGDVVTERNEACSCSKSVRHPTNKLATLLSIIGGYHNIVVWTIYDFGLSPVVLGQYDPNYEILVSQRMQENRHIQAVIIHQM